MREDDFLRALDEIAREYDELTRRLIESENPNQEELYEAANERLNDQLLALLLTWNGVFIPEAYLFEADRMNAQIASAGIADREDLAQFVLNYQDSPYAEEIQEILDDANATVRNTSRASLSYKSEIGQNILRAKNTRSRELARARRRVADDVVAGKSFNDIARDIEELFRNAANTAQEASSYMFRDAGGKRWSYDAYARMFTSSVAGQASLDAIVDQMVEVQSDIAQIPFNASSNDPCVEFQRKYVSVTGANSGAQFRGAPLLSLPELRQPEIHIFHPHCTHFALIYVPLTPEEQERFAIT